MITLDDFCVRYMPPTDEYDKYPTNYTAPQKDSYDVQIHSCRDGWRWFVREFGNLDVTRDGNFETAQEALNDLLACNEPFVQRGLRAVFGIEPAEANR